jgi:hypothetical protein
MMLSRVNLSNLENGRLERQRVCISVASNCLFGGGENATKTYEMVEVAFGEKTQVFQVRKWCDLC